MAETALPTTTAGNKWSQTGVAMTMTALDNANGNKFTAASLCVVIVRNSSGGALSFQITSQPTPGVGAGAGRVGHINQSLAAGEIRAFQLTKSGWQDSNGEVLLPSGQSASLLVGILILEP